MSTRIVETPSRIIQLLNHDLVLIKYKDNYQTDVEDVIKDYAAYDELTQRMPVYKLVISGRFNSYSTGARQMVQEENKSRRHLILGEAIVVNSLAQRILANFYLRIVGSAYPTRLFAKRSDAELWIADLRSRKKFSGNSTLRSVAFA